MIDRATMQTKDAVATTTDYLEEHHDTEELAEALIQKGRQLKRRNQEGNCDRCGNKIHGYEDEYIRVFTANGEEICQSCMFEEVLISELPDEPRVNTEDVSLNDFEDESDLHLWLADVKKEMEYDSFEEAEGARKLVVKAAWKLGVHGHQILQEETE